MRIYLYKAPCPTPVKCLVYFNKTFIYVRSFLTGGQEMDGS